MHLFKQNFWLIMLVAMTQVAPLPARAEAPEKDTTPTVTIKTLVMPFNARRGIAPTLATTLSEAVITTLGSSERRDILGQADLASILDLEAERQALSCDDSGCLEEIAAAMDVDTLITGSIDQVGNNYVVIITELDAREVKQVARVQGMAPLREQDLFRLVTELADQLLTKTSGNIQLYGTLEVQTVPSGIPVLVGNRDLGLSPVTKELPIGTYEVRIHSGHNNDVPAVFSIDVRRKQTSKASVRLTVPQEIPIDVLEDYQTAWMGHALGTGAKGLAGLPTCFFGGIACIIGLACTPTALSFLSSTLRDGSGVSPYSTVTWIAAAACVGVGIGSLLSLCGGSLIGWTAWDLISFPEEPLPGVPQHHVLITPPDGEPITLTLPAREETMAH